MADSQVPVDIRPLPVRFVLPDVADFKGNVDKVSEATTSVLSYLKNFGYTSPDAQSDEQTLSTALKLFQQIGQLPVTGVFDEATKDLMGKPRCGRPDQIKEETADGGGVHVSFAPWTETFTKTDITYRIEEFTPDMTPAKVRRAISDGFNCWAAVTPLSFKEVSTGGDVVLRFHVDVTTDGPNGELARGFALSGITFDEAEDWLNSFNLAAVVLHEVGHVIGLGHSSVSNSTMNPYYGGTYFELHPDDIHGAHSKYGWRAPMWMLISGADANIRSILASSNMLFRLYTNGQVWQYMNPSATGWQQIGNTQGTVQLACENRILYALTQAGAIMRWTGTGTTWTTIDLNADCAQIIVGGGEVYQRHFNAARNYAAIYLFKGMTAVPRWELIDDNPRTRQIDIDAGGPLYQRHDNGSIWRYVGPGINWELISDQADATLIAAGTGGALFYTNRNGTVTRYTRTGTIESFSSLLLNPGVALSLIAKGEHLVQMRSDKSLWRFTGQAITGWERVDNFTGTVEVTLSETGDVYQRHSDGTIWRLAV